MGIIVVIWTLPLCGENINKNEALEPTCTQFVQPKRPDTATGGNPRLLTSNGVISGKESSHSEIGAYTVYLMTAPQLEFQHERE